MTKLDKQNYNSLEFGDIIKINFSSARGHEQRGYRTGLVISDPITQKELNGIVTVVPIISSNRDFFTRVNLNRHGSNTKGDILMDQVKALDLSEREYEFIEKAPQEVLNQCNIIFNAIYEKLLDS